MSENDYKISDDFAGTKYKIADILNKKIVITNYQREASTKHQGTNYYKIQFIHIGPDGAKHLCFMTCGAAQIVQVLDQSPKTPLYKTIIQEGRSFYFKENMASNDETIDKLSKELEIDFDLLKQ